MNPRAVTTAGVVLIAATAATFAVVTLRVGSGLPIQAVENHTGGLWPPGPAAWVPLLRWMQAALFLSALALLALASASAGHARSGLLAALFASVHLFVLQFFALAWWQVGTASLALALACALCTNRPTGRNSSQAVLPALFLVAALLLFPPLAGFVPALAFCLMQRPAAVSTDRRWWLLAAGLSLAGFPLVRLATWLGPDGFSYLLWGLSPGDPPSFSRLLAGVAARIAQAPHNVLELMGTLLSAYGAPVGLLGTLLGRQIAWLNPVSLAFATAVLFHGPVLMLVRRRAGPQPRGSRQAVVHRTCAAQSLGLVALLAFNLAWPGAEETVALGAVAWPCFLLSFFRVVLARADASVTQSRARNRMLSAALLLVLLASVATDTMIGWKAHGQSPEHEGGKAVAQVTCRCPPQP